MNSNEKLEDFYERFHKQLKESQNWPGLYMFKFIVPNGREHEVGAIFPKNEMTLKPSSGGKYVSTTIQVMVESADEVIEYYEKAVTDKPE